MTSFDEQMPTFLRSYGALKDQFDTELDGLQNKAKGDAFVRFVRAVVPLSEIGRGFSELKLRQHSYDGGVDLEAESVGGYQLLFVQSRYSIRGVDDLDAIMSGFHDFQATSIAAKPAIQRSLFVENDTSTQAGTPGQGHESHFMIVTLSSVSERILPAYEKSNKSSRPFFTALQEEGRLTILDGHALLLLLQAAYRKLHILPSNVEIQFDSSPIIKDNVYVGIVSAQELQRCYDKFGDALFLENLRGFLGVTSGRKTTDTENVNAAIIETVETCPDKMLSRNNGLTIRAERVTKTSDTTLQLDNASIVNGCQTTMCVVNSSHPDGFLLVKIVETSDSWDIAKSANFQNTVKEIELELARYVRPQVVKWAASRYGVHVDYTPYNSLFEVMDHVYQDRVTYDGIYNLFIGLFSRNPNNVFNSNYTYLRGDLLKDFLIQDPRGESTFGTLFLLYKVAFQGRKEAEVKYTDDNYKPIFQRFFKEIKPDYQAFLAVTAACVCVRTNIFSKPANFSDMRDFMVRLQALLESDPNKFIRHYCYSFEAVTFSMLSANRDVSDLHRTMYDDIRRSKFENLYLQVCVFADGREPKPAKSEE